MSLRWASVPLEFAGTMIWVSRLESQSITWIFPSGLRREMLSRLPESRRASIHFSCAERLPSINQFGYIEEL